MKFIVTVLTSVLVNVPIVVFTSGRAHAAGAGDNTNVRISPLGLLVGSLSANIDFVVSSNWTVGPTIQYWKLKITSNDGNSYSPYAVGAGLRANWFVGSTFTDGLYVGPSVKAARLSMEVRNDKGTTTYTRTPVMVGSLVGYAWYWPSFNIHLGGGLAVDVAGDKVEVKNADGSFSNVRTSLTSFDGEFSLGYTF